MRATTSHMTDRGDTSKCQPLPEGRNADQRRWWGECAHHPRRCPGSLRQTVGVIVDDATESMPDTPTGPRRAVVPGRGLAGVSTVEYAMIYQAEKPRLIRYLIHCGASYHDADDAAQRALTTLYERWGSVHHHRSWLRKVAMRELGRANMPNEYLLDNDDQLSPPPDHAGIERLFEEDAVLFAIRQLPELQRKVFALRFDQFETGEIASILRMTEPAVRQNLARARARLRQLLDLAQPDTPGQDDLGLAIEGGI